jgi:hypothetical protein
MAEAHALYVEVDDRRLDGRLDEAQVQRDAGDRAARVQYIGHPVPVVQRDDQQEQPGRLRH